MTRSCPCCGGAHGTHHFATPPMPVAAALLLRSAEAARATAQRAMSMWHCPDCGYLWNAAFEPELIRFDADYEGTQIHSPRFRAYLEGLAARWAARWPQARRVIEVGCGQGEFLEALSPCCPAELVGHDPAARLPQAGRAAIHAKLLPPPPGDMQDCADVVLSRMTLEHIAQPLAFIEAKAGWLRDGGTLAVQVPDAEPTIRDAHVCELQYEHVGYHARRSLTALLGRAGLQPFALETDYGGQHLAAFARKPGPGAGPAAPSPRDMEGAAAITPDAVARLAREMAAFGPGWDRRLRSWRDAGYRIHLWGAGSRATAFGAHLPDPGLVTSVIDINPRRSGTYVPGAGWRSDAPETLRGQKGVCIVVMNRVYVAEIAARLAELGAVGEILVADDGVSARGPASA